jgi:hypothetical protein
MLLLSPHSWQAFVLAVNLRFQNELQKLHFLSIWQPLAEYVKAAEPVALAFEVLQADNDPCNIMVYERCAPALLMNVYSIIAGCYGNSGNSA